MSRFITLFLSTWLPVVYLISLACLFTLGVIFIVDKEYKYPGVAALAYLLAWATAIAIWHTAMEIYA